MRIAVVADPHVALDVREAAAWHNPYRLDDAHERLARAWAHPLLADADVVALLGDLAHFGDEASMRCAVEIAGGNERPALLLSGNHDVLEPGVRLRDMVGAHQASSAAVAALVASGMELELHDVVELTARDVQPFDVEVRTFGEGASRLVLTHFPVGNGLEPRCSEAGLLYSAHLSQLAQLPFEIDTRPTVALSGHLHVRGVSVEGPLLQLAFAALVEPPYEVAIVDIDPGPVVSYRCASVIPPDGHVDPTLDPAQGRFAWADGAWSRVA